MGKREERREKKEERRKKEERGREKEEEGRGDSRQPSQPEGLTLLAPRFSSGPQGLAREDQSRYNLPSAYPLKLT
jgi:hypothetical protein